MLTMTTGFNEAIASPVRKIDAKVELYNGSTLVNTFTQDDLIKKITIDRVGDMGKFFGFVVVHKANVHLIDNQKALEITTANSMKVYLGTNGEYASFPTFEVSEVHRDEKTGELSITAYDKLYKANNYTVTEIDVLPPYSTKTYLAGAARVIGIQNVVVEGDLQNALYEDEPKSANVEGTETIRDILNAVAEITQTVMYLNSADSLVLKRYPADHIYSLTKHNYVTLETSDNRRLSAICNATDLGENTVATLDTTGTTQYIRNNPFWDLRDDIETWVQNALNDVGGLTIAQFDCKWRGNPALEIGDKLRLITPDAKIYYSFLLNDSIEYNGALIQKTKWHYENSDAETAANPNTLGEMAKLTYARVDKANKEIQMVASQANSNSEQIGSLAITTESISATVTETKETTTSLLEGMNEDIANLTSQVQLMMTAEDVKISIQEELANGVNSVTTETGFTFNEEGLTVSKSGSEISTTITEDGMTVKKNGDEVLTANSEGVKAVDLHATTYLIIGKNSRFEDWGNRTACFWIGG